MDEDSNLFLLEVNLNPGCSAGRDERLYNEAQTMVETMFETVMGEQDVREVEELKHRRIERLQQKLMGSREFIVAEEKEGEVDDDGRGKDAEEKGK
jgi:hypothetical protein